jgi:serine/threonine protein kinase
MAITMAFSKGFAGDLEAVLLKIITERYVADAAVRQRFLREARAVAKLSRPHIARLYDFGEMDGVLHYVMEYCGGGSLADLRSEKRAAAVAANDRDRPEPSPVA